MPLAVVDKVMVDDILLTVVGDGNKVRTTLPVVESVPEAGSCDAVGRAPDSKELMVENGNWVSDARGTPLHGCTSGGDEGCG